ncbi:MAG UNVERIFIED_CONTAM: hypothetical protein LVQ98_09270 [Rickettsiaceae bacterium]|jgi:hypothetical protein
MAQDLPQHMQNLPVMTEEIALARLDRHNLTWKDGQKKFKYWQHKMYNIFLQQHLAIII